ncbi:MAG: hypothetical protein M3Q22_10100 [Actinomycetota bacterium]|nr:hypothetical protein [Actinomycetota bacterium]
MTVVYIHSRQVNQRLRREIVSLADELRIPRPVLDPAATFGELMKVCGRLHAQRDVR